MFRRALLQYWEGRCAVTGLSDPALLRASHIVPWSECVSNAHRLNVNNGLLLSALWDAAFDAGLVSFDDDGAALISDQISSEAGQLLGSASRLRRQLSSEQRNFLRQHRRRWQPQIVLEP
nr:HNH endonuclease signature motif containing protein [Hansschlegelia quercus]